MDEIDKLLEDLQNSASSIKKPNTVGTRKPSKTASINSANEEYDGSDNDSDFIYEDTNFMKSTDKSGINELDNLLNDLDLAKKNFNKTNSNSKTRRSLEKLIDSLDGEQIVLNSNDNIEPKASQATKELENLMNSLSTFHVESNDFNQNVKPLTPTVNNCCEGCGGPINGQVITALGYLWHPDHFICCYCDTIIGTSIFYEKDGKPYCETDYLELFSPKCANCSKPIVDKMLTALNKTWHPFCFSCSSCSKLLNDESFLENNNNAFCKECYTSKLAPKCMSCNKSIIDNFISAMNSYYHPNCFCCQECGMPFNSSSFFEYNGLPYCEHHYHLKRGSLCSSCNSPINGRCITAMNKKFHPEHFICSFCTKQLNKGTFKEQNDKPYCHPCYTKMFPQ